MSINQCEPGNHKNSNRVLKLKDFAVIPEFEQSFFWMANLCNKYLTRQNKKKILRSKIFVNE